jgi:ABC-type Fe3+-hydroxamate transport system substrate-binding protein
MKSPSVKLLATLVLASSLRLAAGLAQIQSGKEPPKASSVTGCLVKGDEPREVWLVQKDGRIYGLESSKIELNAHLGQKVIVTGYVLPEGKEEPGDETHKQNKASKRETADFRVLTLKMISTTCTQ